MISNAGPCGAPPGKSFAHGLSAKCGAGIPTAMRIVACAVFLFSAGPLRASEPSVASSPAPTLPAAAPADLVQAVEDHYRDLVGLTAKVVQKNFLKSVEKTQKFEGTLMIKRPGKLRLEYTNGQVIVVDGKDAWFYSKQNSQAIRRTFTDFEQANIPVAFLLGAGAIRRDFDVSVPESDKPRLLDLVPKRPGAAMKKLRLHAEPDGRILRMIVYDRSGNTSDVQFFDVKEEAGLDDAQFRFKVPKGTEIIEQ